MPDFEDRIDYPKFIGLIQSKNMTYFDNPVICLNQASNIKGFCAERLTKYRLSKLYRVKSR